MIDLRGLTLKHLGALDAVASTGSISDAAIALSLTPPAVHSQLKSLTEIVGAPVLTRQGSGKFQPTPEGAALLGAYRKTQTAFARAAQDIDALRRGVAGVVVLGVVSTGKYFAPGVVARLKRAYPDIIVRLEIGNRLEIIEGLDQGRIDIAVMGRPPRTPEVVAHTIADHPHVMIASPDNPLVQLPSVTTDQVLAQQFLLREPGSGTRILAVRYLDRIGNGQTYDSLDMNSNETIKQAVIADLGVAIISAHTVIDELAFGRLRLIHAPGLPISRQWFVLHRADHDLSAAMTQVLDHIIAGAQELLRAAEIADLIALV